MAPELSACCGALVTVEGRVTQFWRCTACRQPCDVLSAVPPETVITEMPEQENRRG